MRHLAQVVRNGLGDRAGTCIDQKMQVVQGKTVCVLSCQRSPEPVFLKWKGLETSPDGDFFVRSGPGTVRERTSTFEQGSELLPRRPPQSKPAPRWWRNSHRSAPRRQLSARARSLKVPSR